jgi:hypothetical protein
MLKKYMSASLTLLALSLPATLVAQEESNQAQVPYQDKQANQNKQASQEGAELTQLLSNLLQKLRPDEADEAQTLERALRYIQKKHWPNPSLTPLNYHQSRRDYSKLVEQTLQREYFSAEALAQLTEPSPYWLGVQCEPVREFELQLKDGHMVTVKGGLRITTVTSDSPAEEAKLMVNDIIFAFNKAPTNNLAQLVNAISECETNEATLEIVRESVRETIKATPRLRKKESTDNENTEPGDLKTFDLRVLENSLTGDSIPEGAEYTITLTQFGVKSMTVKFNEEESQTTTDKLDALPVPTQSFAKRLVDHAESLVDVHRLQLKVNPAYDFYAVPRQNVTRYLVGSEYEPRGMVVNPNRWQQLENRLQAIQQSLEELKQDRK